MQVILHPGGHIMPRCHLCKTAQGWNLKFKVQQSWAAQSHHFWRGKLQPATWVGLWNAKGRVSARIPLTYLLSFSENSCKQTCAGLEVERGADPAAAVSPNISDWDLHFFYFRDFTVLIFFSLSKNMYYKASGRKVSQPCIHAFLWLSRHRWMQNFKLPMPISMCEWAWDVLVYVPTGLPGGAKQNLPG